MSNWLPELLNQICQIVDKTDVARLNTQKHLREEIARYERFTQDILGQKVGLEHSNKVDLKDYTKYVLREGTREEKRELLGCLKVKLLLNNRVVYIEK